MTYKRYENESDDELIYRVCSDKEQIGTWQDVADILNGLLNTEYNESAFRKKFQSFNRMLEANQSKFVDSSSQLEEIRSGIRELEKAKIQFRDERNAWNKQNYTEARVSQKMDHLEKVLSTASKIDFENATKVKINSDNDMLILLSDWHIGQTFDSTFGRYNTDIAKERIGELIGEISAIQSMHKSQNAVIGILGDMISGSIHKTLQITNRETVIEQIKIASDLITSFIYEMSILFGNVTVVNVAGNHTRIDRKEDSLHDERLDSLIQWTVNTRLSHIDNINFVPNTIDSGIADVVIRGKHYTFVHGDFDSYSKSGVANLSMMLGYIPYAICYGHLHCPAFQDVNNVKIIRGGSLAGSGDAYTIEKRLFGKSSQTVCVCNSKGVYAHYPIELS